MKNHMSLHLNILFVLVFASSTVAEFSAVETLPGYPGTLPFKLQTGYISVGEEEEVQLFYYFIKSENDVERDPLILWLNGGPGCSAFSGLVYEIGPLNFDIERFDGSFPSFTINPYSWTKLASIIFIDSPVGTGFSYSTNQQSYSSSTDTTSTKYNYMFLKKWLSSHPMFVKNGLYIAGDSYGGKIVPMLALLIAQGNEAGNEPRMRLQGYMVGNTRTDVKKDSNEVVPYTHRMGLVSDEYFELAKSSCDGEYVNSDPKNVQCTNALNLVKKCIKNVNTAHILEPKCNFSQLPNDFEGGRALLEDPVDLLLLPESWCRNYNYIPSYIWANDEIVQEALHIRKGTKDGWERCNMTITYEQDVESVLGHHLLLIEKGYQALVYSGDHDMVIPYLSTLRMIRELNLTLSDPWRAWTVGDQVAGYTETYQNNQLIFATIKGAGHTAPEYKPKECFEMIKRWLSMYRL